MATEHLYPAKVGQPGSSMLTLSHPQLLSLSRPRFGAIFTRCTSRQAPSRIRTEDIQPATLVPATLLSGRVIVCVGLIASESSKVERYVSALSGCSVAFDSIEGGLNFTARTELEPILVCALDSDGFKPCTIAELRSKTPHVTLITLSSETDCNRFGATKEDPADAALRVPLTRTVFHLGLQAALANLAFRRNFGG